MKIKLYHPQPYQEIVHLGLSQHWEDSFHVVKAVRQSGKSRMICNMLLQASLSHGGQTSISLSPTQAQARKIFKDITKALRGIPIIDSANASLNEITFINGSEILLKSAEQGENLRGFTVSKWGIAVVDEAAYVKDDVFYSITPWCDANKSPMVIVSTPKFKRGFFYDLFMQGLNGTNGVYSYDWTSYKNPFLTEKKLEMYRKVTPKNLFMCDYLGMFLDSTSDLFGDFGGILSNVFDLSNHDYYIGIDWGSGSNGDYTAIAVFNSFRQMVDLKYWNDKEPTDSVKDIVDIIKRYHPRKVTVESNSIGAVYYDVLKKSIMSAGISTSLNKFNTTNDSKRRIIENLQKDIQNQAITLLDDTELGIELSTYQMEQTKGGRQITYNAQSGYHDDCIMATAICLDSMKKTSYAVR